VPVTGAEVGPLTRFLARRRVALGLLVALAAAVLADPTWASWRAGLLVAACGEALRVWAAGHLEKGREVTQSGPYGLTAHPLYVGTVVMAAGIVVASRSVTLGVLVTAYLGSTIVAAVRTEEAFLRQAFGPAYDAYRRAPARPGRRFSLARARRNREHRAVAGLLAGFALLALKIVLEI
jgi:protein-S-isoprenylcysteine O-methyltransferase Ste14